MDDLDKNMDAKDIKPPNKAAKAMVLFITAWFIILSALTCALPKPAMYSDLGNNYVNAITEGLKIDSGDTAWVLVSSCLVLFMTPGVAFFYGGMVDHKNVISTMFQSFVSMGFITVLWIFIGFSLSFGEDANGSGIMGHPKTYFFFEDTGNAPHASLCPTIPLILFSMFQLMFAIITPVLISGSLAERVNFYSWMIFICIWHILVYCPLVHIVWHPDGILRKWGFIDFAGGIPVEMASGYGALAGAIFLGPRKNNGGKHYAANVPHILLGTAIFWFGWLGFNAGSALTSNTLAANTFATTQAGAASAMITWIFLDILLGRQVTAAGACNGAVIGLVALTPSSGYITTGSGLIIGVIACFVCYFAGNYMKERTNIDDTLDVFAVHGLGGTVGVLCTGIFASKKVNIAGPNGLIYGNGELLGKHIAVVLVVVPFIMISTYCCFAIANFFIPIRVTDEEEMLGLDYSMHNESLSHHTGINGVNSIEYLKELETSFKNTKNPPKVENWQKVPTAQVEDVVVAVDNA